MPRWVSASVSAALTNTLTNVSPYTPLTSAACRRTADAARVLPNDHGTGFGNPHSKTTHQLAMTIATMTSAHGAVPNHGPGLRCGQPVASTWRDDSAEALVSQDVPSAKRPPWRP